jgi:integrase
MARGSSNISTWDHWVAQLRIKQSRFRMVRKSGKPFIFIREIQDGKAKREFSSKVFRTDSDDDITACAEECLKASKCGRWGSTTADGGKKLLTWEIVAESALENLRARVARIGSRKNAEGHLREIAQLGGPVTPKTLERWAMKRCPIKQPSAFRNRLETLSHINKAGDIRLDEAITNLKAKRPTGAVKKEQERRSQKIKAIASDEALETWLDSLDGFEQWTLALIATYGLRPSEAWHAVSIDEKGWIHIPGDGLTKTDEHFAPPVPAGWVDRYSLRENFEKYQAELNTTWAIDWEERGGLNIPTNNSVVTNALYHRLYKNRIERLYVEDEWVRPYDLRHSYAIRCETSEDPEMVATSSEEFAKWLGHGLEVHKRVYLAYMSADRRKAGLQARIGKAKESPAEAGLSDEILAKLAKLEQLEKLLAS